MNTQNTQPQIMNYDPNLTSCGRMAKQTVRLTFGLWEYRETFEVTVGGNLTGLDIISCAIESLYATLPYEEVQGEFAGGTDIMVTINIGELICQDEDLSGESWLAGMLVAAEIISIEPDKDIRL
ncbi:hypothetical protein AXP45_21240 [Salmonella enterica subsp. enterica]|nr:hypothetical protein [Salmonella enterica subsp. enterica]EAW1375251.1 hypothetical protein [Salmonella enterica subsp. enterica]EBQ0452883.1 hypothetical protein [Salmonella enterica subsp. enterica]EBQ0471331.1 hypothetical protein [Salmonella enterica subsp. enterica]EBQ0489146.1 hypothetical protein [Salmonella enterica subsp. enterica]